MTKAPPAHPWPPVWQDTIIYRAAYLMYSSNRENNKREALKIIVKYHPDFKGKFGFVKMASYEHGIKLAEKISKELGFDDVNEAIFQLKL